jgi:hypothetical protein
MPNQAKGGAESTLPNTPLHKVRTVFAVVLLVVCPGLTAYSQLERAPEQLLDGRVANFRFAEPGELTITVNLVGAVRTPGRYEISRSIDLMDLIALAGGWTELADLTNVHINRPGTDGDIGQRTDLKVNLSDFQNISRRYLVLQHGDFIYVGEKSGVSVQEIMTWVTTAAILTTTYFTIIDRQR